jgi:hypothetical protein
VVGDAGQHVSEPSLRINVVELGRHVQGCNGGSSIGAALVEASAVDRSWARVRNGPGRQAIQGPSYDLGDQRSMSRSEWPLAHDLSPAPMEGRLPGYQGMMQKLTSKLLHMQVHNMAAGDRLKDLMDD